MSSVLLEQLPLIASAAALTVGMLLGKSLAPRFRSRAVSLFAVGVMLLAIACGGSVISWSIASLKTLGMSEVLAKYIPIVVMAFVSGGALAFVLGKPTTSSTKAE